MLLVVYLKLTGLREALFVKYSVEGKQSRELLDHAYSHWSSLHKLTVDCDVLGVELQLSGSMWHAIKIAAEKVLSRSIR